MNSYFKNKQGSGMIGLLVAIVIIAALVYGGSFFWKKNTKETKDEKNKMNIINEYQQAQEDIDDINKKQEENNEMINNFASSTE